MISNLAHRLLPFLRWQRPDAETARADLLAGVAVSLLVVPQSLAYAQLAGVPAHYGLYAALIPSVVGVLFGSSALLSTGPVALTSLLTAASAGQIAAHGTPAFIEYVTLLALLSGLLQIGLGLARAGVLLNLLSNPVLVGFVNAAAVVISLSQLPALTGITVPQGGGVVLATLDLFEHARAVHLPTLALGVLAVGMLVALRRYAPQRPGALIMASVMTALSWAVDFGEHGGAIVGDIPAGLPGLSVPSMSWSAAAALLPTAFVIALVSFMEAASSCKVIAVKTRTRWDENQELIGQGLAKVAAAFCHSMPVSGSFSRTALNLASHARTGYATLYTAAFVLLTLVLFTPLLRHLPKPALAAMVLMALLNLVDLRGMRNAWRTSRDDGIAATLTFVATLAFAPNIQNGVVAGLIFSLGAFIYRRMTPRLAVHRVRDGALVDYESSEPRPGGEIVGVLRFDAALFFANASFFESAVLKLERENHALKTIVVQAQGINLLDATGVETLRNLVRQLGDTGVELVVSGAQWHFLDVAERTGLTEVIGRANFFDSNEEALHVVCRRADEAAAPVSTPDPAGHA